MSEWEAKGNNSFIYSAQSQPFDLWFPYLDPCVAMPQQVDHLFVFGSFGPTSLGHTQRVMGCTWWQEEPLRRSGSAREARGLHGKFGRGKGGGEGFGDFLWNLALFYGIFYVLWDFLWDFLWFFAGGCIEHY